MYDYQKEREELFTERGQRQFLSIRDRVKYLLKTAGAFRMEQGIANESGSAWTMLACVDRLVELGEIEECRYSNSDVGQYRVFTEKHR